jgi:hypothetical protein
MQNGVSKTKATERARHETKKTRFALLTSPRMRNLNGYRFNLVDLWEIKRRSVDLSNEIRSLGNIDIKVDGAAAL